MARPPRGGHVRSLSGTLEDITVSAEADLTAARATSPAVTRETCRRWCVRHSWIPTAVFVLGILLMAAVPGIAILTNRGADPPPVSEVALFVVGDWGREGSVSQNACADAMAAVAPSLRASIADAAPGSYFGVISTGDNFYEDGLSSVDDPAFARLVRRRVRRASGSRAARVWHATLGNHDHRGNVTAQIARRAAANASAGEPGWDAMRRGYREFGGEETGDAGVVGVCFVDTAPWIVRYRDEISRYPHMETMLRDAGGSWSAWEEAEMAWLDTCLTESHAAWRVVVGHHPVARRTRRRTDPRGNWVASGRSSSDWGRWRTSTDTIITCSTWCRRRRRRRPGGRRRWRRGSSRRARGVGRGTTSPSSGRRRGRRRS